MREHDAIVVGVDGSPQAMAAVDLAAAEAVWHARPLRVVHGFIWPYMHVPLGPSAAGPPEGGLRHRAERIVAEAVDRAAAAAPNVMVDGQVVEGSGGQALIESAREASLIVIGDRGLGGFAGLLLGSVALQVAAHATVPVMISRGTSDASLPILVAVDGSPANRPAVAYAFAEASARKVPLTALHVWPHPMSGGPGDMRPLVHAEQRIAEEQQIAEEPQIAEEEERVLAEALAGFPEQHSDVEVRRTVAHGPVRKTIIEATKSAQLVVTGARGRGGFAGLLLGSVSQSVLHHAACPTVIVPRV